MSANPIPGLIIGPNDDQKTVLRKLAAWALQVSPIMFQAVSPLVGILPRPAAPSNSYLEFAGSPSVNFVAGLGTYSFPISFPNGVLAVSALPVSSTSDVTVQLSDASTSGLTMLATSGGSALVGTLVVSLIVRGW